MDQQMKDKLFEDFLPVSTEEWEARILADLKGADYQKRLIWKTDEGFDVKPYYRNEDLASMDYLQVPPGEAPFIRGTRTKDNRWIIRQDFPGSDLETTRQAIAEAVRGGVDSVGIDASKITTHQGMSEWLRNIDIEKTRINFISSTSYPLTLELFVFEMQHRGLAGDAVKGSLNFDPIGYLLSHGDFYTSWDQNLDETEYLLKTTASKAPGFKVININANLFQNAGSTLVQELAFGLAAACEYLAGLTDRGMTVDQVAPFMQWSFAVGPNYFFEIAKLRAARLLWTRMVEQFKPESFESLKIFIHSATALWNKSVYDPYVNMLRTTTEGMSAILGSANSVSIHPFNVSAGNMNDFSSRVARNQQFVLKEEAYLDKIADPAAGSYYIETLTHQIANAAWDLFRQVESKGGLIQCIKSGFVQTEVEKSRKKKEADIAQRRMIMLGTNQFPNLSETLPEHFQFAQDREEVASSFLIMKPFRAAASFEKIRMSTEQHVKAGNKRPVVFLFTMGNLAMLRARAGFATNFFGCAGYEIIDNPGFESVEEGFAAAISAAADIVVICSSDEEYTSLVPAITEIFHLGTKPVKIVVAGYPKDQIEHFKSLGVTEFIHVRSDLLATLTSFQQYLKIS